jgi:hypothetical protein
MTIENYLPKFAAADNDIPAQPKLQNNLFIFRLCCVSHPLQEFLIKNLPLLFPRFPPTQFILLLKSFLLHDPLGFTII